MAGYYPYLLSSLPGLMFGARPVFPFDRLLELCAGFVAEREMALVRLTRDPRAALEYRGDNRMLSAWRDHEIALRNEVVRIRASRKKIDPGPYLRPAGGPADPGLAHTVMHAHRNPSLLEGERMLDEARWRALEALSNGKYFDLDSLLAYGLKLSILIRWENVHAADAAGLLAGIGSAQ